MTTTDKKRIVLLDFLRGILMIWVMIDHFFYDAGILFFYDLTTPFGNGLSVFAKNYESSLYRSIAHPIVLFLFFFISGLVFNFSNSKLKRAIKLSVVAVGLFVITEIFSLIIKQNVTITCGVIEVFAVSGFLSVLIDKINVNKYVLLIIGIILSVIGILFCYNVLKSKDIFYWFVYNEYGHQKSSDYFPLLPYIGYYLMGVFLSKTLYKKKQPLIKVGKKVEKALLPITFIGKTSLFWYLISQAVFIAFFEGSIFLGIL